MHDSIGARPGEADRNRSRPGRRGAAHDVPPGGRGLALDAADLIVFSHLRWDWVWQRIQHLISRIGATRPTWFVEEPVVADVPGPRLACVETGEIRRVWLEVPDGGRKPGFGTAEDRWYLELLPQRLGRRQRPVDVWLYTPQAIDLAAALQPRLLVYDVMDDLSAFADGTPEMVVNQRRLFEQADVVFAGGPSLYRSSVAARGDRDTYLFPSGVETAHYQSARALRRVHARPVAGYVGVLDERLDLGLIADLADQLPDWELQLVGPTTKIDPAVLPARANIRCLGQQPYERLPEVMAGFDVALMPFALNAATRSISPTKTLEYLAAGLPVVSTRVPDVVSEWGSVVHLADTGVEFAEACRHVVQHSVRRRDALVAPLRRKHEWDVIAAEMTSILRRKLACAGGENEAESA